MSTVFMTQSDSTFASKLQDGSALSAFDALLYGVVQASNVDTQTSIVSQVLHSYLAYRTHYARRSLPSECAKPKPL